MADSNSNVPSDTTFTIVVTCGGLNDYGGRLGLCIPSIFNILFDHTCLDMYCLCVAYMDSLYLLGASVRLLV